MSLIEASRLEKLAQIDSYKKEQLERLALKFQTSDQVGYAFNKIAISVLLSIYALVLLNDFFRLCNYIGIFRPKNKLTQCKPNAKANLDDDDSIGYRSATANQNYDARIKSIEERLLRSVFYKKQNRVGNAYI